MSPEQLELLIDSLNTEAEHLKEKINELSMKVRTFPLGCDRYHRLVVLDELYWVLIKKFMEYLKFCVLQAVLANPRSGVHPGGIDREFWSIKSGM